MHNHLTTCYKVVDTDRLLIFPRLRMTGLAWKHRVLWSGFILCFITTSPKLIFGAFLKHKLHFSCKLMGNIYFHRNQPGEV
jgi:hypothetical protein